MKSSLNRLFKKAFVIMLLTIICGSQLKSQNRTWLNYEVGISDNYQSWNTQLSDFYPQKSTHSIVGGYIEQELNQFLSLEIGVNDKFYGFDAYYLGTDTINFGSYAQCVQVPLRLRSRINLFKDKLFLSPHIGVGILFQSYSGIGNYIDNNEYNITIKSEFPQTACLIETGLSMELILKSWKFAFMVTSNYSGKDFIKYSIDNMNTVLSTNGDYFTYKIRIGYAISNIWKRKTDIHR